MGDQTGRVVLFGATGYTGRLTAEALARRGLPRLLVGRDEVRLSETAAATPDADGTEPPTATADAADPRTLVPHLRTGDVLVTTVGPFTRWGHGPALAALETGAGYLDSTGEPPFLADLLATMHERAVRAGVTMLPAFGYDYVPGNLAGALALTEAGEAATRVDVGYFVPGGMGVSGGTAASAAGVLTAPAYAWRGGRLQPERAGARVRSFTVGRGDRTRTLDGIAVGGSEHWALPRTFPQLTDIGVYLGWAGRATRAAHAAGTLVSWGSRIPGVTAVAGPAVRLVTDRLLPGSTGGPTPERRARSRTMAVAEASAPDGTLLARTVVMGPSPYDLTGELLAWGAGELLTGGPAEPGVVGPVDGLGLPRLVAGCAQLGLRPPETPVGGPA